ncbi:MAG: hypothetical protein LBE85_03410, partial [Candidatus Accumulibacter sp.]|nr:hypothetical protein [Accumulibacter sp.]
DGDFGEGGFFFVRGLRRGIGDAAGGGLREGFLGTLRLGCPATKNAQEGDQNGRYRAFMGGVKRPAADAASTRLSGAAGPAIRRAGGSGGLSFRETFMGDLLGWP